MIIAPAIFRDDDYKKLNHFKKIVLLECINSLNQKSGLYYCRIENIDFGFSERRLKPMLKKLHDVKWIKFIPGRGRGHVTTIEKGDRLSFFYERGNKGYFRIKRVTERTQKGDISSLK